MIDTSVLKNTIIGLAVRGELTERLDDDTPVSSSLEEYRPKLDVILPPIPETWKYCKFDQVLINRDSERIPVSVADRKKLDKKYDYYGASGIIDRVDRYLFDEKLLLIGEDGANLISRSTPIAFIAKGKYWVNNHAHVLQATEHVILEYIEIVINSMSLAPFVTGSAQPKLSQKMMNQIAIPIPPIEEQQRIVETLQAIFDCLDSIDVLQDCYSENLAILKNKVIDAGIRGELTEQRAEDGIAEELFLRIQVEKEALIKDKKIKKTKPLPQITEDEIPYDIPENWKWVRFGDVITLLSGQDLRTTEYNDDEDGIPYLTGASNFDNHNNLIINRWTPCPKNIALKNDVLISCKGTVGKIAILHAEKVHIARQFMAIRSYLINIEYIKFFMESVVARVKAASKGLIPGIERKDILNLCFPLPPYAEQERIAIMINDILTAMSEDQV